MKAKTVEIRLSGKLDGAPVHPEAFDLPEIFSILFRFRAAVLGEVPSIHNPIADLAPQFPLTKIRRTGAAYTFGYGELLAPAVDRVMGALAREDLSTLHRQTQNRLHSAFNPVIRRGAGVTLKNGIITTRFSEKNPLPKIARTRKLNEVTSIYCQVTGVAQRKGGRIQIYLPATDQKITVSSSESLAKKLSDSGGLLSDASLEGRAVWQFSPQYRLVRFYATGFKLHPKVTIRSAFEELSIPVANVLDEVAKAHEMDRLEYGT